MDPRSWRRRAPCLVVSLRHSRQLLEKGDDRPDFLVGHADRAKARHPRHLDAVLDHPEQLAWLKTANDVLEVRWTGIQPLGELRPADARSAVAIGTASV